jgi:hypothetical protein
VDRQRDGQRPDARGMEGHAETNKILGTTATIPVDGSASASARCAAIRRR